MTKTIRYIQSYLVFALPFVIACMVWNSFRSGSSPDGMIEKIAWEVLSWNLMIWFVGLAVYLLLLVVSPLAREMTLTRLANIRERDEREEFITGRAARATFLSSLSIILFLLFLSTISVQLRQMPEGQSPDGKTKSLSIGAGFSFFEKNTVAPAGANGSVIFEYQTLSLSKSAMLVILLVVQLGAFHWVARRELN